MKPDVSPARPSSTQAILHVAECYEGGVGRAIRNIVRIMPHKEHLLLARGSAIPHDAHLYAEVVQLPASPGAAVGAVRRAVRSLRPEVVHAHSSWAGLYTRLLPLPVPVVYEPHCYAFEDITRPVPVRALFWLAEYFASHRTASVLTLSPRERALATRLNADTAVHSVPNVPTLPVLQSAGSEQRPPGHSVYMIGRASPQKDPSFFTEIVQEVRRFRSDVEFVWIGDGETEYVELLEHHGVRVTGWLEQEAMTEELRHAGVYVHSAAYEGFPLSVLDAASQGVPVVARDIACFDGTPLIRLASAQQIAGKVVELLTDPSELAAVIALGYELLEHMNESNQVEALERAYAECGI